jgi:CDP-diacylglycerol--glycerol-3-phosphate 3-phosphatidyltransferase
MAVHASAIKTWANLVTVTRVMVAPLMFWMIPDHRDGNWPAFALWFALCCSDKVDGVLARRHGTTTIGAFLDPLADKILILGAMFTLVSRDVYWIVPVAILAVRELGISLYRTFVGSRGVSVPASRIAKLKTLTQQLSVGFAIAPLTARDAQWLWKVLLWTAVALAVISAAQYMWRAHAHPGVRELASSDVGL